MYFGDPEAQRHATDAARFLLRDLVIPRVTPSRLKRAHEGAEVERIYALAVGLEAERLGDLESVVVAIPNEDAAIPEPGRHLLRTGDGLRPR